MFTEHNLDLDAAKDETKPFGKEHKNIRSTLSALIHKYDDVFSSGH